MLNERQCRLGDTFGRDGLGKVSTKSTHLSVTMPLVRSLSPLFVGVLLELRYSAQRRGGTVVASPRNPPSPMCRRGRAGRGEVVDHHADRLLAQKGVEVEATLSRDVGHRPVLEVYDAAALGNRRTNKTVTLHPFRNG